MLTLPMELQENQNRKFYKLRKPFIYMSKIYVCPFCGSIDVEAGYISVDVKTNLLRIYAKCNKCGFGGQRIISIKHGK